MDEKTLSEIEARASAATPGPWGTEYFFGDKLGVAAPGARAVGFFGLVKNADFIAHARVLDALGIGEGATALNAVACIETMHESGQAWCRTIARLHAEVDALRAIIESGNTRSAP